METTQQARTAKSPITTRKITIGNVACEADCLPYLGPQGGRYRLWTIYTEDVQNVVPKGVAAGTLKDAVAWAHDHRAELLGISK